MIVTNKDFKSGPLWARLEELNLSEHDLIASFPNSEEFERYFGRRPNLPVPLTFEGDERMETSKSQIRQIKDLKSRLTMLEKMAEDRGQLPSKADIKAAEKPAK